MELFKGEFIGMHDKNGVMLTEGSQVKLYCKGAYVVCSIIYKPDWAMFCLK